MTPERLAELRALAEAAFPPVAQGHYANLHAAVPELLAEVERLTAERDAADERTRLAMTSRDARKASKDRAEATHRDLVSRLGFGDNITEPMADNDTIVAWFDELGRDADEWREHQMWRVDCAEAGHPDDEDCYQHDPSLRLHATEAALGRCRALAEEWTRRMDVPERGRLDMHAAAYRAAARDLLKTIDREA